MKHKLKSIVLITRYKAHILLALYWQYFYTIKNWLIVSIIQNKKIVIPLIFMSLFVFNFFFYPKINNVVVSYFVIGDRIDGLQTLFLALGGAMIGAIAIAFSLIMFAMQINVERIPYGLFRKFSTDSKLLGLFVIVFFLAITIICLSLISDTTWVTITALI